MSKYSKSFRYCSGFRLAGAARHAPDAGEEVGEVEAVDELPDKADLVVRRQELVEGTRIEEW